MRAFVDFIAAFFYFEPVFDVPLCRSDVAGGRCGSRSRSVESFFQTP